MPITASERLRMIINDLELDPSPAVVEAAIQRLYMALSTAIGQERDLAESINQLGRMAVELSAVGRRDGVRETAA